MKREILLLGDPRLYEICKPVQEYELEGLPVIIQDMHDTLMDFRSRYHSGRAVAAPQTGIPRRLIYMHIDKPTVFINPSLEFPDDEMMTVMDDCMSFPGLLVNVKRHKRCRIHSLNMEWKQCSLSLEGDLSELLQHEYDHLDGILATMRAIDNKSFFFKKTQEK